MVVELSGKREREASLQRADSLSTQAREPQRSRAENAKSAVTSKRWTPEQDEALRNAVAELGNRNWMAVAERVPGRDNAQCLQRWNKVLKPGLVKGPWSVEEDAQLMEMMLKGYDNWRQVSAQIPGRTAKQCRERWRNRLDPSINKAPFTDEEDLVIQQAYEKLGNRWTQIAELLPGRTEDAVKLRWKTLNPNQKTYTKLGRPRLLPTEALDSPPMSTLSPVRPTATRPSPIATPVKMDKTADHMETKASFDNQAAHNLPEPVVEPIGENDSDEKMSEEDIMILNEFLRGQSSGSLANDSLRSMLSLPEFGDELDAALHRLDSRSSHKLTESILEDSDGSKPLPASTRPAGSRRPPLLSMLSIGSSKNMSSSLRSLTADVDPDDRWINGELNRRLSGMSLLEGMMAGSGEFDTAALEQEATASQDKAVLAEFEQQLDTLNDAGSLLSLPIDQTESKPKDASPSLPSSEYAVGANLQSNAVVGTEEVVLEELLAGDDITVTGMVTATTTGTTMTAQDFYSESIPHDKLSHVHRFEI